VQGLAPQSTLKSEVGRLARKPWRVSCAVLSPASSEDHSNMERGARVPIAPRNTPMRDWNVVVSIYQDGFRRAIRALQELGQVERSRYYNVLVMKVKDAVSFLEAVERKTEESPALYDAISRVAPAARNFEFQSAEEFKDKANSVLREWAGRLAGRSFHVRLHRRGACCDLRTPETEKFLDDAALAVTSEIGMASRISFTDPDVVVAVDIVDDRAGVALWTREDLARHRLLRPD
jgi:tRNA(Ser,Leu) C12 N-acetylase TAN1